MGGGAQGKPAAPSSTQGRGGGEVGSPSFDLEQLPTNYTDKWAIIREQELVERARQWKDLTLWVEAG